MTTKPDGEDEVKMTNEDKVAVKRYECDSMECGHKSCYDTNLLEEALAEKDTIISGLNKELEIAWDKRKNYASEADDIKAQLAEKDKRIEKLEGELDDIYVRKECREIAEDIDKVEMMAKKIAELEQKYNDLEQSILSLSHPNCKRLLEDNTRLEQKVAELTKQKEYWRDKYDHYFTDIDQDRVRNLIELKNKSESLEAQCSKMRAALDKYGSHASECSCFEYDQKECNCGYEQALSKGEME